MPIEGTHAWRELRDFLWNLAEPEWFGDMPHLWEHIRAGATAERVAHVLPVAVFCLRCAWLHIAYDFVQAFLNVCVIRRSADHEGAQTNSGALVVVIDDDDVAAHVVQPSLRCVDIGCVKAVDAVLHLTEAAWRDFGKIPFHLSVQSQVGVASETPTEPWLRWDPDLQRSPEVNQQT
jgi:hypothetical protein